MSRSVIQLEPAFAFIGAVPFCVVCASSCSLLRSLTMSGDRSNQAAKNHYQAQQPQALPAMTASAQISLLRDLGPLNLSQEAVQAAVLPHLPSSITGTVWMLHSRRYLPPSGDCYFLQDRKSAWPKTKHGRCCLHCFALDSTCVQG